MIYPFQATTPPRSSRSNNNTMQPFILTRLHSCILFVRVCVCVCLCVLFFATTHRLCLCSYQCMFECVPPCNALGNFKLQHVLLFFSLSFSLSQPPSLFFDAGIFSSIFHLFLNPRFSKFSLPLPTPPLVWHSLSL